MQEFAIRLDSAKLEATRQAMAAHRERMNEAPRLTGSRIETIRRELEAIDPQAAKILRDADEQFASLKKGPLASMFEDVENQHRFLDGVVPGDRENRLLAQVNKLARSLDRPFSGPHYDMGPIAIPIPLHRANPAEHFRLKLSDEIANFEATLDAEEEVGIRLSDGTFWLSEIVTQPPEHVVFIATTDAGERVRIFKHHTQANVMLLALKKAHPEQEARRIGFRFGEDNGD